MVVGLDAGVPTFPAFVRCTCGWKSPKCKDEETLVWTFAAHVVVAEMIPLDHNPNGEPK